MPRAFAASGSPGAEAPAAGLDFAVWAAAGNPWRSGQGSEKRTVVCRTLAVSLTASGRLHQGSADEDPSSRVCVHMMAPTSGTKCCVLWLVQAVQQCSSGSGRQ